MVLFGPLIMYFIVHSSWELSGATEVQEGSFLHIARKPEQVASWANCKVCMHGSSGQSNFEEAIGRKVGARPEAIAISLHLHCLQPWPPLLPGYCIRWGQKWIQIQIQIHIQIQYIYKYMYKYKYRENSTLSPPRPLHPWPQPTPLLPAASLQ